MPEKNANYCYSYLSRKVRHNKAGTTLHLHGIVFPKQLDKLVPMHRATASAEGVAIDITNEHLIRCMLGNSEMGFWSEESVCQQKFELKNVLVYPTSSLAYATRTTFTLTPSAEAVALCIGTSSSSCLGKTMSPRWRVVPGSLCLTFLDR